MDLAGLGPRLTALREARGLSKRALSQAASLHREALTLLETPRDAGAVYLDSVTCVAVALRVCPSDLLWPWPDGDPPDPRFKRAELFDNGIFRGELYARLRSQREGVQVASLARAAGIPRSTIHRIETGYYVALNLEILARIEGALRGGNKPRASVDFQRDVFVPAERAALGGAAQGGPNGRDDQTTDGPRPADRGRVARA